jgi:hypothetical protein
LFVFIVNKHPFQAAQYSSFVPSRKDSSVKKSISRRKVLGNIVCAGAGALLATREIAAQSNSIRIADQSVVIGLAQLSPHTIRLTIFPVKNGELSPLTNDGSLVREAWPTSVRFTNLAREERIPLGSLTATLSPAPTGIANRSRAEMNSCWSTLRL